MREIKFRAWHKKQAKMHPVKELRWFDGGNMLDTIRIDEVEKSSPVKVTIASYLAPDDIELMQFTGLLDYHDKEIYEGDVVEITELYGDQQRAEVFWGPVANSYQWMNGETWLLRFTSGAEGPLYPYCRPVNHYQLEVIGNIYEHPNLLKESDHENN